MIRLLKLSILAAILAVPFWGCETPANRRLVPGEPCLATDSRHAADGLYEVGIYIPAFDPSVYGKMLQPDYDRSKTPHLHIGDKLTVVKDASNDPSEARTIEVKVETGQLAGEFGEMSRADLQPQR